MKLFFRKLGHGQPMLILHGLFGQSDNWLTLGKRFSEKYEVHLVDLRNHGHSPHSNEWSYKAMSDDILELINENQLKEIILMGHSMGGKTAMQFALDHAEKLSKLIVADMAPKYYPPQHDKVIEGLLSIDLHAIKTRKEAEEQLSKYIPDFGTKQFLLKNLYRKEENVLAWRFNLQAISKKADTLGDAFNMGRLKCILPTLFLRGERSNYILNSDIPLIESLFPNYRLKTIANAGHWLHSDQPDLFFDYIMSFSTP